MADERAASFADDSVCGQFTQARAYVAGGCAKTLGNVL